MGNVNEILRRKSLLKDGVNRPADFGEPIFHPSMWKVVFQCSTDNSSFNINYNVLSFFKKGRYDVVILDDVVIMEGGVLNENYRNIVRFFWVDNNGYAEIVSNDDYAGNEDHTSMVFSDSKDATGDYPIHTMYFTLQKQNDGQKDFWHKGWFFIGPHYPRSVFKSIRTPTEEFLTTSDKDNIMFAYRMNDLMSDKATLESLCTTPFTTRDTISRVFKKVKVPMGTATAYANAGYGNLTIEEFKFTPIPDN